MEHVYEKDIVYKVDRLSICMLTVLQYDKHSTHGYCLPPFHSFGDTKTPTHITHPSGDVLWSFFAAWQNWSYTLHGCPVFSTCFFHDFLLPSSLWSHMTGSEEGKEWNASLNTNHFLYVNPRTEECFWQQEAGSDMLFCSANCCDVTWWHGTG